MNVRVCLFGEVTGKGRNRKTRMKLKQMDKGKGTRKKNKAPSGKISLSFRVKYIHAMPTLIVRKLNQPWMRKSALHAQPQLLKLRLIPYIKKRAP